MERERCRRSLAHFVQAAWHIVEPTQEYKFGWAIEAICEHLESVTYGDITRLLINVPPGMMKSLLTNVFWSAWTWGPMGDPSMRFIGAAHSQALSIRDSMRMRRLIQSDWYQRLWPEVKLTGDQNAKTKFENTATGWRLSVAAGSITGERADVVVLDDPLSVEGAASEAVRASTTEWFLEAVPTRLNNPDSSAIVVIMQRLHEEDTSGVIISKNLGYEHLMLPMRFDPDRKCTTSIGFEDPRTKPGELLFPERFPASVVRKYEHDMGSYAFAGQMQQSPTPRGGGIIKRDWWKLYPEGGERLDINGKPIVPLTFPKFDYIIAYADTAYTTKEENDQSALTVWGVYTDEVRSPQIMLMDAWAERLEFNDLLNKIVATCRKRKVDRLIVEGKASGKSILQEIRRKVAREDFAIEEGAASGDKVARVHSVQHILETGMVHAPDRAWAELVIAQCATFPRAKHDDLVDTVSGALKHLRDRGFAKFRDEHDDDERDRATIRKPARLPYDV